MSKDKILDELERIRVEIEAMIPKPEMITNRKPLSMEHVGLSRQQIRSWLSSEPSFIKQIAKSIHSKRTRRNMLAILFLLLGLAASLQERAPSVKAASPNGLPQPHPPNVDDALPYVTKFISDCYLR